MFELLPAWTLIVGLIVVCRLYLRAFRDLDRAAEDPDFVRALSPVGCAAGADAHRLGDVADREVDGGGQGARCEGREQ